MSGDLLLFRRRSPDPYLRFLRAFLTPEERAALPSSLAKEVSRLPDPYRLRAIPERDCFFCEQFGSCPGPGKNPGCPVEQEMEACTPSGSEDER